MKNIFLGLILLASSSVFAEAIDFKSLDCEKNTYQEKTLDASADHCLYRICWAARFKRISLQYTDDLNKDRIREDFIKDFTEIRNNSEDEAQIHINYLANRCDAELSSETAIEKTIVLSLKKDRSYPIVKQIKKRLKKEGNL